MAVIIFVFGVWVCWYWKSGRRCTGAFRLSLSLAPSLCADFMRNCRHCHVVRHVCASNSIKTRIKLEKNKANTTAGRHAFLICTVVKPHLLVRIVLCNELHELRIPPYAALRVSHRLPDSHLFSKNVLRERGIVLSQGITCRVVSSKWKSDYSGSPGIRK